MKHSSPLSFTLHFLSPEKLSSTHLADFGGRQLYSSKKRGYIVISWFGVLNTICWLPITVGEEWIFSCSKSPLSPHSHSTMHAKLCLSFPTTLPIVLHFNFVQISIQCLYYMAMQMILMSKGLLFPFMHTFIFPRGLILILFCFIFTFRLHYILLY